MKIRLGLLVAGLLLFFSASSYAWWGNNGWNGWNPYPVWTPMYWAEEMFDNNDYGPYGPYGPYGYGGYPPYGYGNYPGYAYNSTPAYGNYGYPDRWNNYNGRW